jgi:hypothetical protein
LFQIYFKFIFSQLMIKAQLGLKLTLAVHQQ